ncbi:hypothetical protein CUMW_199730, partial [Citrus unshiu]
MQVVQVAWNSLDLGQRLQWKLLTHLHIVTLDSMKKNIAKLFDFSLSMSIPEGETHITDAMTGK